ncbi:Integral membrane protein 2C [Melipona quadrifasciata]|uniref:Integral membrane protein 2 n=1 Tax=Melipona quadrifasciata TaxID=166423 RepID=A0A0M9A4D7_9HYME|nr:Integral membrane protein 2C [Melipona quadrifasciata]
MTIITKAITEKELPLFIEENTAENGKRDAEAQCLKSDVGGHYFVSRRSIYRIHVTATFLLFLVALMILIIGVIGGLYIYRQYARTQMHRFKTGWYSIPYDKSNKTPYAKDAVHQGLVADSDLIIQGLRRATEQEAMDIMKNVDSGLIVKGLRRATEQEATDIAKNVDNMKSFFKERFEIDLENEQYEKIDVPDFRGGRQGRFIHDFNINKTGIIDIDGQCCFVMPLDRQTVLPPRNMYDLLRKMYNGYYEVNTEIVRETMKVVTPPITDLSVIGTYIARECQDLPTYMLTKVNSNVVKRSISNGVFGQFAGKNIIEFDILNLKDVDAYNKKSPQN